MRQYVLSSLGKRIVEHSSRIHPLIAFNTFVYHVARWDPNWIEHSPSVTDTSLSSREWAGLVIHAFSLMSLTKDNLEIGRDFNGGDGVLLKIEYEKDLEIVTGVFVEQTLVTYKAHDNLTMGIAERIKAKSDKGKSYAWNKHLIIWCNINGEFNTDEIEKLVSTGRFSIVNVVGFNGKDRTYTSLIFDKDEGLIHRFRVAEKDLVDDSLDKN